MPALTEAHLRPTRELQHTYNEALEAAIRRTGALEPAARRIILDEMRRFAENVNTILTREIAGDTESVDLWRTIAGKLNEGRTAFQRSFDAESRRLAEEAWEAGTDVGNAGLGEIFHVGREAIPLDIFDTAYQTLPDLIGGATDDQLRRIRSEVVAVSMGTQPLQDAIRNIGVNLDEPNHFRSFRARAEAILITETNRLQAVAAQREQERIVGLVPEIRKRWVNAHTAFPRAEHIDAESRYGLRGDPGPIPIDALYSVGGEQALYPRAGNLSARNTVHCRCVSITTLPESGLDPDAPPAPPAPPTPPATPPEEPSELERRGYLPAPELTGNYERDLEALNRWVNEALAYHQEALGAEYERLGFFRDASNGISIDNLYGLEADVDAYVGRSTDQMRMRRDILQLGKGGLIENAHRYYTDQGGWDPLFISIADAFDRESQWATRTARQLAAAGYNDGPWNIDRSMGKPVTTHGSGRDLVDHQGAPYRELAFSRNDRSAVRLELPAPGASPYWPRGSDDIPSPFWTADQMNETLRRIEALPGNTNGDITHVVRFMGGNKNDFTDQVSYNGVRPSNVAADANSAERTVRVFWSQWEGQPAADLWDGRTTVRAAPSWFREMMTHEHGHLFDAHIGRQLRRTGDSIRNEWARAGAADRSYLDDIQTLDALLFTGSELSQPAVRARLKKAGARKPILDDERAISRISSWAIPRNRSISTYGDTAPGEDFAETIALVYTGTVRGSDAFKFDAFRDVYPNRAKLLAKWLKAAGLDVPFSSRPSWHR